MVSVFNNCVSFGKAPGLCFPICEIKGLSVCLEVWTTDLQPQHHLEPARRAKSQALPGPFDPESLGPRPENLIFLTHPLGNFLLTEIGGSPGWTIRGLHGPGLADPSGH